MEVASETQGSTHTAKRSSPKKDTLEVKHEFKLQNNKGELIETRNATCDTVDVKQLETPLRCTAKNSRKSARKANRLSSKPMEKKYMLRSSSSIDRVLRSRVRCSPKAPSKIADSTNVSTERNKKRKKRKRTKGIVDNGYSRIRKRLRYLLNRTNYEQSLIDAYAGEGWRGQSAEKIKPEKELQRATSEILRRKLRMRDLFQQLDSLCAEGRFQESLFDADGLISSEDIFCAKCRLKDLSADNDIILCDGTCNRGFHQMCLEPPLLKEEIPPGDEGWLCPGCDCKVDCLDLLNDYLGTDLSITDSWEKVFPEAAVTTAGDKLEDNFGLPSDDSEDNDYDPDGPEPDEKVQTGSSSSDESDFTSASDVSGDLPRQDQNVGLPSDDSGDNDYDPTAPDADDHVKTESSSSDFTSDSGDSGPLSDGNESSGTEKVPKSSSVDGTAHLTGAGHRQSAKTGNESINSELLSIMEPDSSVGNVSSFSGKRLREKLDYKQLHDEAYGNSSSDSSDDEDWNDADNSGKMKKDDASKESMLSPKGNSRTKSRENTGNGLQIIKARGDTRKRSIETTAIGGGNNSAHKGSSQADSTGIGVTRFGEAAIQRLLESFADNQYPSQETKETLATELGVTARQVARWFENNRRKARQAALVKASEVAIASPSKEQIRTLTNGKSLEPDSTDLANECASSKEVGRESVGGDNCLALVVHSCSGDVEPVNLCNSEKQNNKLGERCIVLALGTPSFNSNNVKRRESMTGKGTRGKSATFNKESRSEEKETPQKATTSTQRNRGKDQENNKASTDASENETPINCPPTDSPKSHTRRSSRIKTQAKK